MYSKMDPPSPKSTKLNPKTKQDLFRNLPPEITINILSRLPLRTTKSCKCVCKLWLGLNETPEFVKSYLSKSVCSLAIVEDKKSCRIVEFEDTKNSGHHCTTLSHFTFPHTASLHASANGLLFLFNPNENIPRNLFICNPITREYVKLPPPKESSSSDLVIEHAAFGFGASKISGQYKLVRVFHEKSKPTGVTKPMCEVYTLGTGSWRIIEDGSELDYQNHVAGVLVNGNLHWIVFDPIDKPQISCFDLESETFTSFVPPFRLRIWGYCLSSLRDRLCFSDNSAMDGIVIWLMKDRDGDSWERAYVIKIPLPRKHWGNFFPIKAFKDGYLLMALSTSSKLFCYSKGSKTIREYGVLEECRSYVAYTPSFLSLETLGLENVTSF